MTVRVLIVDDSPTMRSLISASLRRDSEIEVVGTAGDPLEAREAIKRLNPDVITLDVEMPNMDGLSFLEKIMRLRPMPVVMVSTLTQAGAEATIAALELGAVDCVGKPTAGALGSSFSDLAERVKAAARARIQQGGRAPSHQVAADYRPSGHVLAIGSSTGGVEALLSLLSVFPKNCPPTLITQHMPANFTRSFADRLNKVCAPEVCEAEDGAPLQIGRVYLAPGGSRHLEIAGGSARICRLREGPPQSGHCPSVDALFHSVARQAGAAAVGLILTGMGRDGAAGLSAMRNAGARTFGQDEESSVVYGMPKAAFEAGAVERQLPLNELGRAVLETCESRRARVA